MEYEVLVQLKGEVLDPEARAIRDTLLAQGVANVESVTIAKRYVISIGGSENESQETIKKITDTYLANPVSQTYKIKRLSP